MIRDPVGFPTDLANAVPLLLSEALKISSISFGTVLESGYGIGHEKFVEYVRAAFQVFRTLFSAVGRIITSGFRLVKLVLHNL